MPGIWAGGAEAYEKAIREEYERARRQIQAGLDRCKEPIERQKAEEELERLKEDFERRLKAIERSLFGVP